MSLRVTTDATDQLSNRLDLVLRLGEAETSGKPKSTRPAKPTYQERTEKRGPIRKQREIVYNDSEHSLAKALRGEGYRFHLFTNNCARWSSRVFHQISHCNGAWFQRIYLPTWCTPLPSALAQGWVDLPTPAEVSLINQLWYTKAPASMGGFFGLRKLLELEQVRFTAVQILIIKPVAERRVTRWDHQLGHAAIGLIMTDTFDARGRLLTNQAPYGILIGAESDESSNPDDDDPTMCGLDLNVGTRLVIDDMFKYIVDKNFEVHIMARSYSEAPGSPLRANLKNTLDVLLAPPPKQPPLPKAPPKAPPPTRGRK